MKKIFQSWRQDLPASLVVFLVALPLCLGVSIASTSIDGMNGMPNLVSGLIAGVIGGIVVGIISRSSIGVSGPAAGLITIVLTSITSLGSYESFLLAVVFSGVIQIIAGFLGLGILGSYFPNSVIKGMLASIGITLMLKEFPHAVGYDADFFGDESFLQNDGHNTLTELIYALNSLHFGSVLVSIISISFLLYLEPLLERKYKLFKFIPGALIIVCIGILMNQIFYWSSSSLYIPQKHLVQMPVISSVVELKSLFSFPDFTQVFNSKVYSIAVTIAIIGSLETLLSVEATDKLDPKRRHTPKSRELKAQGVGNIVSGLIGGLPITQVIVRSSANVTSGGVTKLSTILHGFLLLISLVLLAPFMKLIPLASLASILLLVGYKLTKLELFQRFYRLGWEQFVPFAGTVIAVLFTNLLVGICIGVVLSLIIILRHNFIIRFEISKQNNDNHLSYSITLNEEVTFLNKASLKRILNRIPENTYLVIDCRKCRHIDYDVMEMIDEFQSYTATQKNINVKIKGLK